MQGSDFWDLKCSPGLSVEHSLGSIVERPLRFLGCTERTSDVDEPVEEDIWFGCMDRHLPWVHQLHHYVRTDVSESVVWYSQTWLLYIRLNVYKL